MEAPKGMEVDHINGNKLDNRKQNLRLATRLQNAKNRRLQSNNSSGFKGVYWHKGNKKWCAYIQADGKWIYGGGFDDKKQAHEAYKKIAKKYHGEFARII